MLRVQQRFDESYDAFADAVGALSRFSGAFERDVASLRRSDNVVRHCRKLVRDVRIRFDRMLEAIPPSDTKGSDAA